MIKKFCFASFLFVSGVIHTATAQPVGGYFLTQVMSEDWDLMREGAHIRIQPIVGRPFYGFGRRIDSIPEKTKPFDFFPGDVLLQRNELIVTLAQLIEYLRKKEPKNSAFERVIATFFAPDSGESGHRTTLCGFHHQPVHQ